MNNKALGSFGENIAAEFLERKGHKIRKRNYRCKFGEIDIISEKEDELIFTEVKTRTNDRFGRPCESVDKRKKEHIHKTAYCYFSEIERKGHIPKKMSFDIVEITLEHIRDAFFD